MNSLKRWVTVGAVSVIIVGTLWHFVYDWTGQNRIIGLFFPVNESTWEHMKLAFFPMLIYSVIANRRLKADYPCITSALCAGIVASTVLIPVIFYTYTGILGYNVMVLDILTFVISIIAAFIVIYYSAQSCNFKTYQFALKALVVLFAVCFAVFTFNPPNIALFEPEAAMTWVYIQ